MAVEEAELGEQTEGTGGFRRAEQIQDLAESSNQATVESGVKIDAPTATEAVAAKAASIQTAREKLTAETNSEDRESGSTVLNAFGSHPEGKLYRELSDKLGPPGWQRLKHPLRNLRMIYKQMKMNATGKRF